MKRWSLLLIGFYFGIGFSIADRIIWDISDIIRSLFGLAVG